MLTQNRNAPYVVLRSLEYFSTFWTTNTRGEDPTKGSNGETWYEVIGYAETEKDALDYFRLPGQT